MRSILGYRSFFDLRRGWRFNNPNLEQLGLMRIDYQDIDELAADEAEWASAPQVLQAARPAERARVLRALFDVMRQGLCIATRYLDRTELDQLRTQSYANLREPWGFTEDERPVPARWFVTSRPKRRCGPAGVRRINLEEFLVIGSSRSRLGRELQAGQHLGWREPLCRPHQRRKLPGQLIEALLKAAASYGLVRQEDTDVGLPGWQLQRLRACCGRQATWSARSRPMTTPSSGACTATSHLARQPRTSALRLRSARAHRPGGARRPPRARGQLPLHRERPQRVA
jgi:hypothetical protein